MIDPGKDSMKTRDETEPAAESAVAKKDAPLAPSPRAGTRLTQSALAGRAGYAREELVAEIGAAFLCAGLGITPQTRDDHAAYIASWLKVLKDDKRVIFTAASHAKKAADYLHGLQPKEAQS